MGKHEDLEMYDFIDFFLSTKKASEQAIKFVLELPDDNAMAFSVISTMVDAYCTMHDLNTREVWENLYEISGQVYEDMGPMRLQKGGGKSDTDNTNI